MKRKTVFLMMICCLAGLVQAASSLEYSATAPTVGSFDIYFLGESTTDATNVAAGDDGAAYVAHDRPGTGQSFTTGSLSVGMAGIWLKNVAYTTYSGNGTWWDVNNAGVVLQWRVSQVSGTALTVLSTSSYTVTGSETGVALMADNSSVNKTGTGTWVYFGLDAPVTLAPNTTYAFDIIVPTGTFYFETTGLNGAASYTGGTAYQTTGGANRTNSLQMNTVWDGDHTFVILNQTPLAAPVAPINGAINVSIDQGLSWDIYDSDADYLDLYFGVENDPNLTTKPAYKKLSMQAVSANPMSYDPGTLLNDTTYYWRVDLYEPNEVGYIKLSGPVWSFKTAPLTASISAVSPAFTAVDAGTNAVLTVTGVSVASYQWYKIDSPDVQLTDGDDYAGVTTDTLTIKNVQLADEGNYYCIGTNDLPSSASNRDTGPGRVMTKRLTSHYPFEVMNVDVDPNGITPDVVSGFDMRMTNEAASAGLPVLGTDVAAASLGTYSLVFDNADEATDPNGQFALIANDAAKYEDITIAVWVKYNGGNDWQRIYDLGSSTTNYMFLAPHAGGAGLRFAIMIGSGEQQLNAAALTVGEWTHVVVTINGNTGRLYVNGELVDTNTGITYNPIDLPQTANYVGKSQFADPEFNGLIDELKIYNYARTTVQVGQDYLADTQGAYVCNRETYDMGNYDTNNDCIINLTDFVSFAARWLEDDRIY